MSLFLLWTCGLRTSTMPHRRVAHRFCFVTLSCRPLPSSCHLLPCCPLPLVCHPLPPSCRSSSLSCRLSLCSPLPSLCRPLSCYPLLSSHRALPSLCRILVPPVAVIMPPVALLPLAIVMPPVAILPIAVVVPPVAILVPRRCVSCRCHRAEMSCHPWTSSCCMSSCCNCRHRVTRCFCLTHKDNLIHQNTKHWRHCHMTKYSSAQSTGAG